MKNKLILILLMCFLSHCGYSAIYSNKNLKNISINITNIEGDYNINKVIERKLTRYINNTSTNEFNIKINSNYSKIITTKDAAGNATNYKLNLSVNFIIEKNSKIRNFSINEDFIMSKMEDIIEEKKYEVTVKDNLINSIIEELIRKLHTIE